jgi:hypothetical protein
LLLADAKYTLEDIRCTIESVVSFRDLNAHQHSRAIKSRMKAMAENEALETAIKNAMRHKSLLPWQNRQSEQRSDCVAIRAIAPPGASSETPLAPPETCLATISYRILNMVRKIKSHADIIIAVCVPFILELHDHRDRVTGPRAILASILGQMAGRLDDKYISPDPPLWEQCPWPSCEDDIARLDLSALIKAIDLVSMQLAADGMVTIILDCVDMPYYETRNDDIATEMHWVLRSLKSLANQRINSAKEGERFYGHGTAERHPLRLLVTYCSGGNGGDSVDCIWDESDGTVVDLTIPTIEPVPATINSKGKGKGKEPMYNTQGGYGQGQNRARGSRGTSPQGRKKGGEKGRHSFSSMQGY